MKRLLVFLVAGLSAAVLAIPSGAAAAPPGGVAVPATCTSQVDPSQAVPCAVTLTGFAGSGDNVRALLTVTNELTGQSRTVTQPIDIAQAAQTCTILDLTLGPIDLSLLGIRVQTNEIHLSVTAERGTLLGNLLCGLFFDQPNGGLLGNLLGQGAVSVA